MKFLISLLLPATIFAGQFHAGPVGFEPNRGQLDAHVRFVARQHRCELSLTSSEAVVSAAERGPVRLSFLGANPRSEPGAEERLPGIVNYFSGNDPRAWRTGIPLYAAVRYRAVYPGIDVVYHGDRPKLEYDFVLAPGANPAAIRVRIEGAGKLELDKNGDLKLGDFRQQRPAAWQENDSGRRTIEARYVRRGRNEVGIELGAYDQRRPLVIDPVFVYATYLGGSRDDDLTSVATDSHGNTYVAGDTYSADFPTRSAYQSSSHGFQAAFVSKFDPTGALVYSTYLSGSGNDYALGVAADTNGYAYVTGVTDSANFPTTSGVIQPSCPAVNSTFCNTFGFVTKLAPSGSSLVYSTYFGGKGGNSEVYSGDTPAGIAVDGSGNAYITGQAATTNMPVANALQPAHSGYSLFESTNGGSSWQQAENNLPKSDLLSIAIDPKTPSTLYAAPLAGGFWKSTDGGHSWVEKDQGLTSSPIGVIAVDPVNPQNIYLGLDWASAPCGIYKSTDGANSWTLLNNGLTECDVKALAFNPQNTATIYAGVSSAKAQPRLFVSNDGGAHWSAIATNLPNSGAGDIHFLAIDPKTPSTMYAVAHVTNSSGTVQGDFLYKSTDSGATWIESDAGLDATIWSVAIDPAATSTIYTVNDISLYRSTDGGSTWTSIGNGLPVASLAAALVVLDPVTPSTMYVAAAGGLFKSTDSGANFTPLAPAQVNSPSLEGLLVNPQNTSILYAAVGIQPDAFVAELNATGSKLVYSTYLGGSDTDLATAIAVDAGGEAYVTGFTISDNFPVAHALYPTRNGSGATGNVFVTKLSTGATQLLWSTYFGGTQGPNGRVGSSFSRGIAVDGAGDALITGFTLAADFPVAHPLQPFLTGFQDAFVSKFASDGSKLIYSTYLGGSSDTSGYAIATDSAGNAYVTGNTSSIDFPLVNPTQCYAGGSDAFASTLKPDGSALSFSTFLGGTGADWGYGIAADNVGNVYVGGDTLSTDFPLINPQQPAFGGGTNTGDGFVARITPAGASGADVSVVKCASATAVDAGSPLTYTLYGINSGPQTATAVTITDTLPPGVTFNSATPQPASQSGNTLTFNLGTLAGQASSLVTIKVTPQSSGTITNRATISAGQPDPNSANNASSAVTTVNPGGSCVFQLQSASATFSSAGGTGSFSFTASNSSCSWNAQSNAGFITITSASSGSGSGTVTYSVAPNSSGSRTGTITAAGATFTVNQWNPPALTISKTHSGNFAQGQVGATYTITVGNAATAGPTSSKVTVAEAPPAGETVTKLAGSGWTCGTLSCSRSDVLNGGVSWPAITVTVNISASAASSVTNKATVSGGGSASATASDPTTIANTAAAVTNVTSSAANGTYGAGASIPVNITFSKPVSVTGTPQLALNSGGTANYSSGSGTATLTFTYVVAAGQSSSRLDEASATALTVNGGTIADSSGTAPKLTLPAPAASGSLGANKDIVIDTTAPTAPTVVSWSVLFGSQSYNVVGSTRHQLPWQITGIQVVFSKPIASGDAASLGGITATGFSGLGTNTLKWTFQPIANLAVTTTLAATGAHALKDASGNPLNGGAAYTRSIRVLWGDVNDDSVVSSADVVLVNNARSSAYSIVDDMNGDGVVDATDVSLVRAQIGATLP